MIINSYLDLDILNEGFSLPIAGIFTIYFILQKLNDNLMTRWHAPFIPIYILLLFRFLKSFIRIIKTESHDEIDEELPKVNLQIKNFDRVILISNFFTMINSSMFFLSVYYLSEFLDKREDEQMLTCLYLIIATCISQIIYSALRKTALFSIKRESVNGGNEQPDNKLAFISSLIAPALTYMSNMMIVCNSGVCTQVYMSTIASLLGAFGVTLSDFSEYLFPITIVLLGISLFSLYIKNKKLLHKPFLLGVFSCSLIIISHVFEDTSLYYLIYPGNILMIGAAIWNARVNKFYGLPKYNK
jgi:MFS family permease